MVVLTCQQTLCLKKVGNDMLIVFCQRLEVRSLKRELSGIRNAIGLWVGGNLLGIKAHKVEMHEGSQSQRLTTINGVWILCWVVEQRTSQDIVHSRDI